MKEIIRKKIDAVIKKEFKIQNLDYDILVPEREEFGDFSSNVAFVLAKELGKSPREIADAFVGAYCNTPLREIDKIEVAGGGFVNFFLSGAVYEKELNIILREKSKYSSTNLGKGKKIQVEFISANPTGPLTMGNGRGGFSGDTLANVLKKVGYDARREYYINDAGNQVQKILAKSIYLALGIKIETKEGEDIYKGDYIDFVARKIKKQKGLTWVNEHLEKTGEMGAKIILDEFIKKDIKFFGIKYDRWFSERSLFRDKLIHKMWDYLKAKKLVYELEGAYWLKTSEYGDEKDRVVKKSDGEYTYLMSDVAYFYERFLMRKFNKVVMILGADHHGYVNRAQAITEILGQKGKLKIILTQFVRLIADGKEVRMSKRRGTFITLREAVEDLGVEASRYFFISRDSNSHIDIDLDLAKSQTNKNPVYYIQYASARINSVLSKVKSSKLKGKNPKSQIPNPKQILNSNDQNSKYEISLIRKLSQYPELIKEVGESYEVYRLAFYAHELATVFHKFYDNCRIIGDEREIIRLKIIKATKVILEDVLKLMGIEAKAKM